MIVPKVVAHLAAVLRRLREERSAIRSVDRFVSRTHAELCLDHRRNPWSTTVVRSGRRRLMECRVTVHRYDPLHLLASHVRGRVRRPVPFDREAEAVFRSALVRKLRMLRRCLDWETALLAAGHEAERPAASVYGTDLITRRLLDAWGVDAEVFVMDAPHPLRSTRWTVSPSAAVSWYGEDAFATIPRENRALSPEFPPMVCDFDVDFLHTRSISLDGGVRVQPHGRKARASIFVPHRLPATVASASVGLPFAALIAHRDLADPALTIVEAEVVQAGTLFQVADPIVPLGGAT